MIKYKLKHQVKRAVHLNHFVKEVRYLLGKGLTKKEVMRKAFARSLESCSFIILANSLFPKS